MIKKMSDSDDSDIFVEYQKKPVNKLTVNDGIRIKEHILRKSVIQCNYKLPEDKVIQTTIAKNNAEGEASTLNRNDNTTNKKSNDCNETISLTGSCNNSVSDSLKKSAMTVQANALGSKRKTSLKISPHGKITNYSHLSPKKKNGLNHSPNRKMTDYFSPTKCNSALRSPIKSAGSNDIPNNSTRTVNNDVTTPPSNTMQSSTASNNCTNITLSPGIKRRKTHFKQVSELRLRQPNDSPVPAKRVLFHVPPFAETNDQSVNQSITAASDAEILKTVIDFVEEQQRFIKAKALEESGRLYNLLSKFDELVLSKYNKLDLSSQTFYMRMFFRKKGWHRTSTIKYEDLSANFQQEISCLQENGFVEVDVQNDDIKVQLNLLKAPEVSKLCKQFGAKCNVEGWKKKDNLIEALIKSCKQQKSAVDLFRTKANGLNSKSRLRLLSDEVKELLQSCFRLEEKHQSVLTRALLLFSMFHDVDDESKRASSQRLLIQQVLQNTLRFVSYQWLPSIIFQDETDLTAYEHAINLRHEFEIALQEKQFSSFNSLAHIAKSHFSGLVADNGYCSKVQALPSFLRRFSAGSVYAHVLSQYCEHFKKHTDSQMVIEVLTDLLHQHLFNVGSRGKWYELLCQAYHSASMIEDAATVILWAGEDEYVDEIRKLSLQIKGKLLLKTKKKRIENSEIREKLDDFTTHLVQEPASIEINAKALSGNVQGSKLVYIHETEKGTNYSSVEEVAIHHYKLNGFTEGIHDEGFIVSTIYYILFFEIIYAPNIEGVFQSPFQYRPLDFYSSLFYTNRKILIDDRLIQMKSWTLSDVRHEIDRILTLYKDLACIINWKDYFSTNLFCDIIDCLQIQIVTKICERFVHKPRLARSGFPDLILWNTFKKKIKFVEVKSPNDKLSCKQRMWMDFLKKIGVDCEVCNVKNTAGKKLKPVKMFESNDSQN